MKMDYKNLVSIIVAAYNVEDWLDECLKSILNQTYSNWECIIINDGSSDNTEEIARRYCDIDRRFIHIKKTNGGIASVRNLGIEMSKGEFVYHVDGDDLLTEDCIEYCIKNIGDADVLAADCIAINRYGNFIRQTNQGSSGILNNGDALRMFFSRKMLTSVWSKFYRRSSLRSIRFNLSLRGAEDLHFNAALFLSNKDLKIKVTTHPIYKYRILQTSISHEKGEKRLERLSIQIDEMDSLYKKYKDEIDCTCLVEYRDNMVKDITSQFSMMGLYKKCDIQLLYQLRKWVDICPSKSGDSSLVNITLNSPNKLRNLIVTIYFIPIELKGIIKSIIRH